MHIKELNYFKELSKVLDSLDLEKVQELKNEISNCKGTVYILGNGGSSSVASHACNDILKSFKKNAQNLADNTAVFSAFCNDINYNDAFSEILKIVLTENDIVICLSTSGRSENVLNAFNYSKNICKTFFISGSTSLIKDFVIQSSDTQIIEDVYSAIFHCICKI